MKKKLSLILLFNISSLMLFFSWFLPVNHGFWSKIDSEIFYFFNHGLVKNRFYLWLVALTNHRIFDICSLLVMIWLMLWYSHKSSNIRYIDIILINLSMLLTALALNQLSKLLIPIKRSSPTLFFSDVFRVSDLLNISVKDASKNSFPGDHGIMLFVFLAFVLRYFGKKAFSVALIIILFFLFPRVMIGAHWFSDIAVGSLSVALIGLPWFLMTPLNDHIIRFMNFYIFRKIKYFKKK